MVTVIVTVANNNTFGFESNFATRSGFMKKTHNFSNSLK